MSNFPFPILSTETLRQRATASSWQRGLDYFDRGHVFDVVWRERTLTAQVVGSQSEPYSVNIHFNEQAKIQSAYCSCPYEGMGDCKHIIATLLVLIYHPEEVSVRPPLPRLLENHTREQLLDLILALADEHPAIIESIENFVKGPAVIEMMSEPQATPPEITAELAQLREHILAEMLKIGRQAYREYSRGDDYWDPISDALAPGFTQAEEYLELGEPRNALLMLEATTQAWIAGCSYFDSSFLEDIVDQEKENLQSLAELWSEALLSAALSADESLAWEKKLTFWKATMTGGETLDMPLTALRQGWDYPPLVAAMQGTPEPRSIWGNEAPGFAANLTRIRLHLLRMQHRHEEALHLAEAEGLITAFLEILVEIGEYEEAASKAHQRLQDPREVLSLAILLLKHGAVDLSFDLALHGLSLGQPYQRLSLTQWLRDQAQQQGKGDLALQAAWEVVKLNPTMENYLWLKSHLEEDWEIHQPQALKILAEISNFNAGNIIEIYLLEKMYPQAMALAERYPFSNKLEAVIQAVSAEHPRWAFDQCYRQATLIIDNARSNAYYVAVDWLRKGRDILLEAGEEKHWQIVLDELLQRHKRKYKLIPLLEQLRE